MNIIYNIVEYSLFIDDMVYVDIISLYDNKGNYIGSNFMPYLDNPTYSFIYNLKSEKMTDSNRLQIAVNQFLYTMIYYSKSMCNSKRDYMNVMRVYSEDLINSNDYLISLFTKDYEELNREMQIYSQRIDEMLRKKYPDYSNENEDENTEYNKNYRDNNEGYI